MGYYTQYELKLESEKDFTDEIIELLEDVMYMYSNVKNFLSSDTIKWYEHDTDMLSISKRMPEEIFILSGHGEESGDVWRKFYRNGELLAEWTLEVSAPRTLYDCLEINKRRNKNG